MFDVKLEDGRYFKNVLVADDDSELETIEDTLKTPYAIRIFDENDDTCEDVIAELKADEIEYICKCYKYKDGR